MRWWRSTILTCTLLVCGLAGQALALGPENLLLIVNKNVPESARIAEHYAQARHVPAGRILALDLPTGDEIPFEQYESRVIPAIRAHLRDNHLKSEVTCLVTFYGVPLRIGARKETLESKQEIAGLEKELADVARQLLPTVQRAEELAIEIDPQFQPLRGETVDALARRIERVGALIGPRIAKLSDPAVRDRYVQQYNQLIQQFSTERANGFDPPDPATPPSSAPAMNSNQATTSPATQSTPAARLTSLEELRFDPDARRELREAARRDLGLFAYSRIVAAQRDYLLPDATDSAVDNELPLLWWSFYRRSRWEANPMFYRNQGAARTPPVVMVMRLDAPKPEQVDAMISTSIKIEEEGLKGSVVLDAGGGGALDPTGKVPMYHEYDRSILRLAALIKSATSLTLHVDTKRELLPPNSFDDVALYCGWYSPGKYVPCVKLAQGAVAFHVASYELTSLHNENGGWCRGLLSDGAVATLGPVAEPYLHSFPAADDFFPLLLTGKQTLAEVYWNTTPLVSWRIAMVGDPLYAPFKTNPQLKVDELPAPLRKAMP